MQVADAKNQLIAAHTGRFLTVAELARVLGVKPATIYYWIELGLEPSFRVNSRGRCYFLIEDVLTWLTRHRTVVRIAEWRSAA